ncbi:carboxypeptidase regulatory-like domain-containing protein [Natronobeatus ordinarius]|uniref:carboxypeptidase regulatory-like domain-containing protein n=1 Tax=Natronobeatus ordinarius TaxID=2963433 RepID=UPI0020CC5713|nr:carboxypeptidase regulatory-like domain-containing protein [Natronobeatus ordinarius]
MTTNVEQIRAVFLAALMVLSVFAIGGIGMAGSAVADDGTDDEKTLADYADDDTGVVETDGLREAIDHWRSGEIDTNLLRDVIDAWRSGDPVEVTQEITGVVTDEHENEPIEGATVSAEETKYLGAQSVDEPVTTDADGVYTIEIDEPGAYSVGVEYEGATADESVDVEEGETVTLDFALDVDREDGTIEGTVTDAAGDPIEGAEIVDRFDNVLTTTDADGTYALAVEPGEHTIRATADGYQDSKLATVPVDEDETIEGVDFELEAEAEPGEATFDLGELEGEEFEQGETYEREAGLEVNGEFAEDAEFTIQLSTEDPDGELVDIGAEDDFEVESVFIPGLAIDATEVVEDNVDDGVFYLDETVTGEQLTAADGEQLAEVTVTAGDEAQTGEYTFTAALVEFDDDGDETSQAVRTIDEEASATFEIVEALEADFDLSEIEGEEFEQGETYERDVGLEVNGDFAEDAEFAIQLSTEDPDGEPVDIGAEDDFQVESVFIPELGISATEVVEDNVDDGVFYLDETVSGDHLNAADGEQLAEVTVTAGDEAQTGEYTFTAALVEFDGDVSDGESQAIDTVGDAVDASFEIVETLE